jgi:hypothetical protein
MGHLAPFKLLPAKKGTCEQCAVNHEPEQPHNQQSMAYQYWFYNKHGRWPTWRDAMAHCSDEIKALWIKELATHGVTV